MCSRNSRRLKNITGYRLARCHDRQFCQCSKALPVRAVGALATLKEAQMSEPGHSPYGRTFGYADEVSVVRQTLTNPNRYGCLLIGPAGIGRTTVMNMALRQIESHSPIHRFRGSEAMRNRELGILELVLSQAGSSTDIGPGAALSTVADVFAQDSSTSTPIVRVDNANLVDSASLSVLCQLAEAGKIRLLAGAESIRPPIDLIAKLWLSGKLTRIDLNGLDQSAIAALAATSNRNTKSAAELYHETGGNPRLLNHLLFGEDQIQAQDRILWNILDDLKPIVEICAITGAMPYEVLARLCPAEALDALADCGIVTMTRGRDAAVRISEPVIAEALRSQIMPSRSLGMFRHLQTVTDIGRLRGQSLYGYLRWALTLGFQQPVDRVFDAMVWANSKGRYGDAAALVRAAKQGNPELALECIRAEKGLGNIDSANRLFDQLLAEIDVARAPSRLLSRMASMDMRLTDPKSPETLRTSLIRERLDSSVDQGRMGATQARFEQRGGRFVSSRNLAENVYRTHSCLTRHRVRACAILGTNEVFLGQVETGLHYITQAEQMFALPGITSYEVEDAAPQFFVAHYVAGEWTAARNSLREVKAGDRMKEFIGALVDLRTGHPARAQAALAEVLSQGHEGDFVDIVRIGKSAKRYADALLGKALDSGDPADVEQVDDRVDQYAWWGEFESQLYDLQTLAMTRPDRAGDQLFELGAAALDRDACTVAVWPLIEAARLGSKPAVEKLGEVASQIHGSLGHLAETIARALSEGTANALLEAARVSLEFGAAIVCSDLARQAQKKAVTDNDRTIVREARALIGNSTRTIRFGAAGARLESDLSGFERNLVDGVVAGRSSSELGEKHHLSTRTIDWHLGRIYQRLHVANRKELRVVVATWQERI